MQAQGGYRSVAQKPSQNLSQKIRVSLVIKDSKLTSIGSLLNSMTPNGLGEKIRIIRQTEEERRFFHDLEDRVFNWWCIGARQRVEIEGDNGNAVRKLL